MTLSGLSKSVVRRSVMLLCIPLVWDRDGGNGIMLYQMDGRITRGV